MGYENPPVKRSEKNVQDRTSPTDYNRDIEAAKIARNNQLRDTDPTVEKEGFLGVDDLDRIRRKKLNWPI